jgi:hypothetical protein
MGGIRGVWIGSIEGGESGQTRGAQMGAMSSALVQNGRFSPFEHRHWQPACAANGRSMVAARMSLRIEGLRTDARDLHGRSAGSILLRQRVRLCSENHHASSRPRLGSKF